MSNPPNRLDPAKHHLYISFWPETRSAEEGYFPTVVIMPYDSRSQVVDAYNSYCRRGIRVTSARFLAPGEPPGFYYFGGAAHPPNPQKWHLHLECWQYLPIPSHAQPTTVIEEHASREEVSASLVKHRRTIFAHDGKIIYAAFLPPATVNAEPIVMIDRAGA